MIALRLVWIVTLSSAVVPATSFAQFTVDNPVILSPAPSLGGFRYAAPDLLDREPRFNPDTKPEKGVLNYTDRDFIEENVPPYVERDAVRSAQPKRRILRSRRPEIPTFGAQ
ncbi:hypothetical protein [Notoacmeibacter sp. MSK16QG-6]|uniref:hypothetical protein n=1 Tax=Notoacmeibacter sp. MSK16QG-6 TaxID=2957982 RepID=UPI00209E37A8|nr:hypothetical protein [Notoacmeibacter sp. MSK16QG-6]MCP1199027.1 hypothetical protein [Notoacmeibacter sp. MSK16QG-6]